jgi:hypothetical protein
MRRHVAPHWRHETAMSSDNDLVLRTSSSHDPERACCQSAGRRAGDRNDLHRPPALGCSCMSIIEFGSKERPALRQGLHREHVGQVVALGHRFRAFRGGCRGPYRHARAPSSTGSSGTIHPAASALDRATFVGSPVSEAEVVDAHFIEPGAQGGNGGESRAAAALAVGDERLARPEPGLEDHPAQRVRRQKTSAIHERLVRQEPRAREMSAPLVGLQVLTDEFVFGAGVEDREIPEAVLQLPPLDQADDTGSGLRAEATGRGGRRRRLGGALECRSPAIRNHRPRPELLEDEPDAGGLGHLAAVIDQRERVAPSPSAAMLSSQASARSKPSAPLAAAATHSSMGTRIEFGRASASWASSGRTSKSRTWPRLAT